MRDVQKLRDLLERLEKASGPDREIDNDLMRALEPLSQVEAFGVPEFYTASLDASVALVERMLPSAIWLKKDQRVATLAIPSLDPKGWAVHHDGAGATFPLAILSALLRALISQAEGEVA